MASDGYAKIGEDMVIKGTLLNGGEIEVHGHFDGRLEARHLVVHEAGRVHGEVKVETAEVRGLLQGEARVKSLMRIAATGEAVGRVLYGAIAVEPGGHLSADVRNIPPELFGDLSMTVGKGRAVHITTRDLTAVDPDDAASDISFKVSNAQAGWVAFSDDTRTPVETFTQADLVAGRISFVHDGSEARSASFDIVASDDGGGSSGGPKTVKIGVRATA